MPVPGARVQPADKLSGKHPLEYPSDKVNLDTKPSGKGAFDLHAGLQSALQGLSGRDRGFEGMMSQGVMTQAAGGVTMYPPGLFAALPDLPLSASLPAICKYRII